MKTIAIKGEMREAVGSTSAKHLKNQGQVPCVLYGPNENKHFAVYLQDFKHLVYTPNTYKVQLDLDNKKYVAKLQQLQFHPVSEAIIHADFLEINEKEPTMMRLPVEIVGNAPGVIAGGRLAKKIQKLRVKGLIKDMPDSIPVDISSLVIGKSVKVGDLSLPNLELLDSPANAIVSVVTTRAVAKGEVDAVMGDEEEEAEGGEGEATEAAAE